MNQVLNSNNRIQNHNGGFLQFYNLMKNNHTLNLENTFKL